MKFRAPPSRKKVEAASCENRDAPAPPMMKSMVVEVSQSQSSNVNVRNYAVGVGEAHQDGCTGNFWIFESAFGNYLVPVIPTRAELGGG
ncbi:hypothetical protein ACS0TY_020082 [Phlomoides rotata]